MMAPEDFPCYSFSLAQDGSWRALSPSWSRLTGYAAEDVSGHSWHELLMPAESLSMRERWQHWLASREPIWERDMLLRQADGSPLPVRMTVQRESLRGYLSPQPLVQQQARHVQKLEARLDALFRTGNQSIVILDLQHRILDFNQSAAETARLRFHRDMQRGESFAHYVQPDRMDDFYESFQQVLQGRHVFKERVIYAPDRQGYSYEMTYTPIYDDSGRISSVCFSMLNIEHQRQMQLLLNHEQSFVSSILNATNALMVVVDRQGRIVRFNKACERITGYSSDETRDQVLWDLLVSPDERERVKQIYTQAGSQLNNVQYRLRDRSGGSHFISWSLDVMQGLREDTLYIVSTGIDVTDRLAAEQALQESEAMLLQAQKMEAVGHLAGGIAHDFNNLLTAIMGYGQLLERSLAPDAAETNPAEQREYVDEVLRMCGKARELTRQLLMFSRKAPAESRPINVSQVLGQMEGLIRQLLEEPIQLLLALDPEPGWIQANALHLEQVMMNLVVNARDAMQATGSAGVLRIATGRRRFEQDVHHAMFGSFAAGDYVCLSVADTGCGMAEETRRCIFDPFFTTKERGKGTGLGLAVVYRIVREFRGWVDVASLPGQGSTFELYFPVLRSQQLPTQPADSRLLLYKLPEADQHAIRGSLQALGEIQSAAGPEQLQACFEQPAPQGPPQLLITPLAKGGLNGQSSLLQRFPQLQVLYLAGDSEAEMDLIDSLGQREDVLLAPYSPEQVRVRVQRMLKART